MSQQAFSRFGNAYMDELVIAPGATECLLVNESHFS